MLIWARSNSVTEFGFFTLRSLSLIWNEVFSDQVTGEQLLKDKT